MKTTWIEKSILAYYCQTTADGETVRQLVLFGRALIAGTDKVIVNYYGFDLTLWSLLVLPKKIPDTGGRVKEYPLLKIFTGDQITAEIEHPEDSLVTTVRGIEYTITPHTRYTAYARLKRFHHISEYTVYSIKSPVDLKLAPFTFSHKDWKGRIPTAHEVVNRAHTVYEMLSGLKKDLNNLTN